MRRATGLLMFAWFAACAPKPAEPLDPIEQRRLAARAKAAEHEPVIVHRPLTPKPAIDLSRYTPDFDDELRWPLSPMDHPELAPQFPIAAQLAQPGVDWIDLCGAAQNRYGGKRELLAYLRGWCAAIHGDADAAVGHLGGLLGTVFFRIDKAVERDLANILASHGGVEAVERLLARHRIHDLEMLDILAATYIHLGREPDARAINWRVIDSDVAPSHETQCRRWARHIALGANDPRFVRQIEKLATVPRFPDETCKRIYHKVSCAKESRCAAFFVDQGLAPSSQYVVAAVRAWDQATGTAAWWAVVDTAMRGITAEGAAELAVGAMENSLGFADRCSDYVHMWINLRVAEVRPHVANRPELAARLDALIARCR